MPYPTLTREQHKRLVWALSGAEGEALYGKRVVVYLNVNNGESRVWTGSKRRPWPRTEDCNEIEIWRSEPHTLKQLYSKDKNFQYIDWKDPDREGTLEYSRLFWSHVNGEFGFKFPLGKILSDAYENYNINGTGIHEKEPDFPSTDDDEIDYSDAEDE